MITPPYLKKGDIIGIVSPAKRTSEKEINNAIKIIEGWGYKTKTGKHVLKQNHQYGGTDEERAEDLQAMFDDKEVKAILCSRGGYGTARILDRLNLFALVKMPKWIIGFSDVTALHSALNHKMNIESLHAVMPINFPLVGKSNTSIESLENVLKGKELNYAITAHELNIKGKTEGLIVGGNLSVLCSLAGSQYDIDTNNKILFLEDLDDYLYRIDRMMMNLKLAGKLDQLRGIIVGDMIDMHDNDTPFGKNAQEIIKEYAEDKNIPVCFGFPAGHGKENLTLILGRNINMEVGDKNVNIIFS